jgi:hypothetical protein
LYGDSFSACVDEVECFEDILNADTSFAKANYLLNYGIGGYGVCQSSLLCRKTAPHYQRPLVVFGMLTSDVERTILPVRNGQKPYYALEDSQLVLKGLPIDSVPSHYFETHPVGTTSYLLRRFLKSDLNFLPYRFTTWYDEKEKSIANIQAVNAALIAHLAQELRSQSLDFVFLIFHYEDDMMSPHSEDNWHDQFLRKTLADNAIPYIWSKDIIRAHRIAHPQNHHEDYIIPGNGHPTTLYNQLIAAEIQKVAARYDAALAMRPDSTNDEWYEARAARRIALLRQDSASMSAVAAKAVANGRTLEAQIWLEGHFLMNLELANEASFKADGVFEGRWRQ